MVTVSGSTVAVKLSVMKLRETDMLVTMRHDQTLQNAVTRCGLSNVVNDGKPPLRGAVIKANPSANKDEIEDYLYEAMEQYQSENAKLFDIVYDSIDFGSEWEILDAEHVRTNFVKGAVGGHAARLHDSTSICLAWRPPPVTYEDLANHRRTVLGQVDREWGEKVSK